MKVPYTDDGTWEFDADIGGYTQVGPYHNPRGIDWLTETLHGFDIYTRGFVQRPTLFFDPTATTSLNRGTFQNPYNTQAALQSVIKGDMRGQVLGFKRGTTLQASGTNGLNFAGVYGASGDPFIICPYGDAEALPIVSAHAVPTWTAVSGGIYKYAIGATEHDIWQDGVRVWKLNPTNGSTNNNTGTTVTNEATALTALAAKGAGWSVFISNTLYFYPYSGENPNLGQVYVSASDYTMLVQYSDVAASGYIEISGLDLRYARKSALEISALAKTTISTLDDIVVAGCKIGRAGVDTVSPFGSDAVVIYGASDTVRSTGVKVVGNELYGVLNNTVELSGTTGALIEHNYGHDVGGNVIAELWASNSGAHVRYNYGNFASVFGRCYQSYSAGGVWFNNNYETGGVWSGNDATNAKNVNNKAYFNLCIDPGVVCFDARGGSGHVAVHNTFLIDHDRLYPNLSNANLPAGLRTSGTAATGFLIWSNNLIYYKLSTASAGYLNPSFINLANGTLGAANSVPSGDKNVYFNRFGYGTANWRAAGTSNANFTTYKTALSTYGLDQNSLASLGPANAYGNAGGTETEAEVALDLATGIPGAGSTLLSAGATSLTGVGTRYKDGQPYAAATPTIGAYLGG